MINSLNSSRPLRVIVIHGLNNNLDGFYPLRDEFVKLGHDCQMITLPGHGDNRNESRNFISAFQAFDRQMKHLAVDDYVVVAFSQGALLLQLWLETNYQPLPKAQVLLAPALLIKHQSKIQKLLKVLPGFGFIPSQTPKKLKRFTKLHIWEYRTLFEAVQLYQALKKPFRTPTMIMVDPQDELIDVQQLEKLVAEYNPDFGNFHKIERNNISAPGLGKHHVIFHPDYFEKKDWDQLINHIHKFII